jgi:hypothetical protein
MKTLVHIVPFKERYVRVRFMTIDLLFDAELPVFEKIAAYQSIAPAAQYYRPRAKRRDHYHGNLWLNI